MGRCETAACRLLNRGHRFETRLRFALSHSVTGEIFTRQRGLDDLIFGLIRLRSPTFIDIQIYASMQVADVYGIQRTIILTPENRKVDCSSLSLVIQLVA